MSIFDKQQDLENFPDEALIQLGQQPDPQYPSYLVMSEVERRRDMRQRHEAEMAKHQAANPPDIATQRMNELGGIAGVDPAMGQGPPPEDMAALQGGIAGGPPPGMEQMGGPPPDMGGPPPGMEGQPPMMAYGGLIPGYQNGGLHDEEGGFFGGLWDEYGQPYIEEAVEGIRDFPNRTPFTAEGRRRREEYADEMAQLSPEARQQLLMEQIEGSGPGMIEAVAPGASTKGIMSLGKMWPRIRGAVGSRLPGATRRARGETVEAAKGILEAAQQTSVKGRPGRIRDAEDVLRAAQQRLEGVGSRLSFLRPGSSVIQGLEREVTFATKAADKAAAVTGAIKKDGGFAKNLAGQLAERTATARDAAIKALGETADPRGWTRRAAGELPGLLWRNKKKTGIGALLAMDWFGQERAAGGLIPGYHGGHLVSEHGSGPGQHLADEDPEGSGKWLDPTDQGWALDRYGNLKRSAAAIARFPLRLGSAVVPADWDFPLEEWAKGPGDSEAEERAAGLEGLIAQSKYGNVAELEAMAPVWRGGSGKLSEEQYQAGMENQRKGYADLPTGHWAQAENPFAGEERARRRLDEQRRIRAENQSFADLLLGQTQDLTDKFLTKLQTASPEQIERRKLWADEAGDETDLLARELGLSTERVAELRGEMRTEKETDHVRKARLLSGLGAALMGNPRDLGSAIQGTTTGLEDLDEELRIERRRDLGDVYTQRAKGLSAERSGRAGIRSLKDKRYADIIAQQTAGEGPAYQGMMDMYGRTLAAETQAHGSRMTRDAQMARDRLTMGQFDPARWDEWEDMYGDLLKQVGDPNSPRYDEKLADRIMQQKYDFLVLGLDAGMRNLQTADPDYGVTVTKRDLQTPVP